MPGNIFGESLQLTSFGESHGAAVGGVLDGFPPGIAIDFDFISHQLQRRRPGQSEVTSRRSEPDQPEILSGIYQGKTTGAPIAFIIRNRDARREDYKEVSKVFRPSHADYTWNTKFGHTDPRGGGRSSARETAVRVAAGAFAQILLREQGIRMRAYTLQIGEYKMNSPDAAPSQDAVEASQVRCPDAGLSEKMTARLLELGREGDSTGGVVECRISGCPVGLGEPVYGKLNARLAAAMMSINAAAGFETGEGFAGVAMTGSQHNDPFIVDNDKIRSRTNHAGGIQGGLSNGEEIIFRVAFKPAPSIGKVQQTVDRSGKPAAIAVKGRHDPCVVPRAVPVVEAMAALVIADLWLLDLKYRHFKHSQ